MGQVAAWYYYRSKKKKKNETDFIEFCANGKGEVQIVREI